MNASPVPAVTASPKSSKLWQAFYLLRDAREGAARNPLAAIAILLIIAFAVSVAGSVWLAERASVGLANLLEEQAKFRVFLKPGADADSLIAQVRELGGVRQVTFVSKDEALAQMNRAFGGRVDLGAAFSENPFSDSLEVQIADPAQTAAVADAIGRLSGVDEVVYGQAYVGPILRLAALLRAAGAAAVALVAVVALIVGVVTWHLALLGRSAELRIKLLMGVHRRAILAQYGVEGALLGLLGGLVAALAQVYGVSEAVQRALAALPFFDASAPPYGLVVLASLAAGLVLGALGSTLAVRRVLRRMS